MYMDDISIGLGGGKTGRHAILVTDAFLYGSSTTCETFRNPTLASRPDFVCHNVELWAFN